MKDNYTLSSLAKADFNQLIEGKQTALYVLSNAAGAELCITNYGAKIVSLMVPDRDGKLTDVVTGHKSIADYLTSEEPYFGAICGRYGNRIAKGRFEIDGTVYDQLAINNGPNSLHGGLKGFNAKVWDATQKDTQTIELQLISPDGEEGFPGELHTTVTYQLTDDNEVIISYRAVTTKPTVLNLTNHSYFNLSGAGDPYVGDHLLQINADYYLPTDETAIPYGPKEKVEGTPMDFRQMTKIGARINEDFDQLKYTGGYDHNYVLDKADGSLQLAARAKAAESGIQMDVYTTCVGVQFYAGNFVGGQKGKDGVDYVKRQGFCLETQYFPNSVNEKNFKQPFLSPGETYESTTKYCFSIG